jgi:probable F420-dependent oxidoreductase
MITIPNGTLAYGMQLPIQSQSSYFVADWERTATPADLARVAQTADASGFFYVAVCDHIALPSELANTTGTYWQDCFTTLGWLAGLTKTTALMSHVLVLAYRHPLTAAKAIATLDHLSGGRAIVGVGAGHVKAEFEALDVPFEQRGRILDAHLDVLTDALENEYVGNVGARPRPVQAPRPPIWVGGSSPAAIKRAARKGDGWLPQSPATDEMVALLRSERVAAGRADEPMAIGHITPVIYMGTPTFDTGAGTITGTPAEVAGALLAGTVAGVNQIQVRFRARTCDELCEQISSFGRDVAPLLSPR